MDGVGVVKCVLFLYGRASVLFWRSDIGSSLRSVDMAVLGDEDPDID
ncbi:hypothetical protein ACFVWF_32515 [Rhodococcus qingshengii]